MNLPVRDPAACRDFYERHFGFRRAFEAADGYFLRNAAGFLLALTPADDGDQLPPTCHVGFHVGSPKEVLERRHELSAAGIRTSDVHDARPSDDYVSFRCWDPNGTEIEILWDTT